MPPHQEFHYVEIGIDLLRCLIYPGLNLNHRCIIWISLQYVSIIQSGLIASGMEEGLAAAIFILFNRLSSDKKVRLPITERATGTPTRQLSPGTHTYNYYMSLLQFLTTRILMARISSQSGSQSTIVNI